MIFSKDPDDFPVSEEAIRDVKCLDCGTEMTREEREYTCDGSTFTHVCCNCGSTELDDD